MKNFYRASVIIYLIAVSFGLFSAATQNDITGKPFEQWSKSETAKILTKSPWAKEQEIRIPVSQLNTVAGAQDANLQGPSVSGGANAPADFRFTVRLRSGLPVRQALVRTRQLEGRIDRMSAADRAAFDARNKGLLECPACAGNYVVTISSKSINYPRLDPIYESLKTATVPQLKSDIYIANERGERRELVHFVAPVGPGAEATFFFARFDEKDKPLLTTANRKLIFRFNKADPGAVTNFDFDVSKLIMNGEVMF